MNKVKEKLLALQNKEYTPKFKEGDIIINDFYKIVRRVIKIECQRHGLIDKLGNEKTVSIFWYHLKNLENTLVSPSNSKYNAIKQCMKIDAFYELVDPKTAEIIYATKTNT